jgi:serine/threonine protein kinase
MTERFGNFEILRRLAAGGMAEVLLAKQRSLGGFERLVCLKRILPHLSAQEDFLRMFQDEARIAANLVHPNIAQIYDIGEQEERYYIAMEYVRGEDVRRIYNQEVTRGQTIPRQMAALMVMGAAAGLDYAHRQTGLDGSPLGIVHRDISPQNIVVTYDGHAKIVDFGVAKAAGKLNQTRSGVLKGKYSYMSPEQASGDPVDGRTDIFALGITLYETTTGVRLFKRENELETLHAVIACNVTPPSQLVPRYDKDFEAIVLRALAYDADHRYQTAGELEQDLERYLLGHGYPTSASHLAAYMQDLFAEKLADEALFGGPPWHEPPAALAPDRTIADTPAARGPSAPDTPSVPPHAPGPDAPVQPDGLSKAAPPMAETSAGDDWPTRVDTDEQTLADGSVEAPVAAWTEEPTVALDAPDAPDAPRPPTELAATALGEELTITPAEQTPPTGRAETERIAPTGPLSRRDRWPRVGLGLMVAGLAAGLAYGLLREGDKGPAAADGSRAPLATEGTVLETQPVATPILAPDDADGPGADEAGKRPPPGRALLSVHAPVAMDVLLGNVRLGTTPLEHIVVEPGNLRLKLINRAAGSISRHHIHLGANTSGEVRFPDALGQLFVTAKPWAWVQHGDDVAQETPAHYNLYEGDYTFVLECPDGRRRIETVHVQSGQDSHVALNCGPT